MNRFREVCCVAALALCFAGGGVRAEPVTIEFRADRLFAAEGEVVNWTVWADMPLDAPSDAYFVSLVADIVPSEQFAGNVQYSTSAILPQFGMIRQYGTALYGVRVMQPGHEPRPMLRRVPLLSFSVRVDDPNQLLWFDIEGSIAIASVSGRGNADEYARRGGESVNSAFPVRIDTDILNYHGCSRADLAVPFGELDAADTSVFIGLFLSGSPLADLAAPYGIVDFADLSHFFDLYAEGCFGGA